MEEIVSTYWTNFVTIYDGIRPILWVLYKYILLFIFSFGMLRFIFKYATATKIGRWENSAYTFIIVEKLYLRYLADDREKEIDAKKIHEGNSDRLTGSDGDLRGVFSDLIICSITGLILIWCWPALLTFTLLFGPIQLLRNHHMKKKIFIAKLKGEEIDA